VRYHLAVGDGVHYLDGLIASVGSTDISSHRYTAWKLERSLLLWSRQPRSHEDFDEPSYLHTQASQLGVLLVLIGTGLRAEELCGLRAERVDLRRRRLEVATVRYDAGRFGRGYKPRPKSTAGIRSIPPAALVVEELRRHRPADRSALLFPDASRYRLRHAYLRALRQARAHGHPLSLDLRGPHDLRHTFATWLEDDGIPARVIDELMGHAANRRSSWATDGPSAMGAVYRHTTTAMEARILQALDTRLAEAVGVVEASG
jgi:integrase